MTGKGESRSGDVGSDNEPPLAIIAGSGMLPRLIAEECARRQRPYQVVRSEGTDLDWISGHPVISAAFEKPGRLFASLRQAGCRDVAFAGGIRRPKLRPMRFDVKAFRLAPQIFKAVRSGDDNALRIVSSIFEEEGFRVVASHTILTDLLAPSGVLTQLSPSEDDMADAARAAEIARALGTADVGQGVVVAQGICLGLESIQGTDAMLEFVSQTGAAFRPDPEGARGVLLKAPKPGQDWRSDLPAVGPQTITNAHKAGLAGVVIEAGGVLMLGLDATVERADALGLFIWAREP